jgi:hypothetical protein
MVKVNKQNFKKMKKNTFIHLMMVFGAMLAVSTACEDEALNPYVEPLPGVHAFAQVAEGSAQNFLLAQTEDDITFDIRWVSVDSELSVEKIDLYVLFNENYVDIDENPRVARHGGDEGVFFATIEGADLPANREDISFSISQEDVAALYQGATFDYDDDGTAENVFDNAFKPTRSGNVPFIPGDNFAVRWELTTTDGLVYDSWSPSVCTELPGANCEVAWILECGQVISEPAQDYTIAFSDTFGDGWNGAAVTVLVDGEATNYTLEDGSSGSQVVSVPVGTSSLSFAFVSGDFDGEVSFTITTEKGNIIYSGGAPAAGPITLDLCAENN